jgi:RNA polymerase sigma-70 factor, ECF subfamily
VESQDELVRRARGGDVAAFDALIHEHYADCLRYATRMLGDRADAEDVVQESFVRAFHALARYSHRDRFRAWLLRIVRNRCRSVAARRAWRLSALQRYFFETQPRVVSNGADLTTHDVERALAALAPKLREAFLLRHVEQLHYHEIADITGASEAALKMRVKRACEALQALLGEKT